MARVPDKAAIYESADKFRQNCLIQERSLIWPTQASWSVENINGLDQLIMGNPDVGERDFFAKLHDQLSGAPDDIHRVTVDVLAFYYLFPTKYPGPKNKVEALRTVISWKLRDPQADLSLVSKAFDEGGLGRGGMAYHVQRPSQIHFVLQLAARIKSEHLDPNDAKAVQRIADSLASEIQFARSARNIALHLLYPEEFERTASDRHKKLMVEGFKNRAGDYCDLDDALKRIRQSFVSEGHENFDFYNPGIRAQWEVPEEEEEPPAKGKRVWIFQSNPKYYDVDSAVRELSEQTWLAAQSPKQIQVGDTAYIWKSGPEAGIIAVGSVITEPAEMFSAEGEDKYNHAPERFAGKKLRVRLRIDKVLSTPIMRAQLKSHPKLSSLTILSLAN
jgi:EVE domain-containing protein